MKLVGTEEQVKWITGVLGRGVCPIPLGFRGCDDDSIEDCIDCWRKALNVEVSE